jgi:hypothetical protein
MHRSTARNGAAKASSNYETSAAIAVAESAPAAVKYDAKLIFCLYDARKSLSSCSKMALRD